MTNRVITTLEGASWARTWHQLLCSLILYAILIVLVKIKERLIPRKKPSKAHPETFAVDEAYKHFIAVWVGDDDTGDLPQKELLQDFLACGQLIGSLLCVACWVVKAVGWRCHCSRPRLHLLLFVFDTVLLVEKRRHDCFKCTVGGLPHHTMVVLTKHHHKGKRLAGVSDSISS